MALSHSRRVSVSYPFSHSPSRSVNKLQSFITSAKEAGDLTKLCAAPAKDVGGGKIYEIDADVSVDTACDVLIERNIPCVAVRDPVIQQLGFVGLFDCADVNAFLTLAATSHLLNEDDIDTDERAFRILAVARDTGKVPVHLCTDLSDKNPLNTLPANANVLSLLELFSRGHHRVIVGDDPDDMRILSDINLLAWFLQHAEDSPTLSAVLAEPLPALGIGSRVVISLLSTNIVLDAMKLMSEQGVSSVAVVDTETGDLLSAISVTDIARLVAPSQSKKILSMPLVQFIALIKAPDGSQDGVDRYPVFSIYTSSTLSHAIQKMLATNSHRAFLTEDPSETNSPLRGNLRGVVSVVDVLSVLAHLAGISDVDPTRMQRQRRESSNSTSSSRSTSSTRIGRRSSVRSLVKNTVNSDRKDVS